MTPKQAEAAFNNWWHDEGCFTLPKASVEELARAVWLRAVYEAQATFFPHSEYQDPSNATEGRIAIQGKALAIFGSPMGYAGPVIQDYVEFDDRELAIVQAKELITKLGLPLNEEISRPCITRMIASRGRKGKS